MIQVTRITRIICNAIMIRIAVLLFIVLTLVQCTVGGTMLVEPDFTQSDIDQAQLDLQTHVIKPPRNMDNNQMHNTLVEVWQSLREPLIDTCREVFATRCEYSINRMQVKLVEDHSFNAYADASNWVIGIHSGLMQSVGDDDEIAAVLGHEAAHLLFEHSEKKLANSAVNSLIGGVLLVAVGAALDMENPGDFARMAQTGMEIGGTLGYLMHSPEMELEADQFAMYALARADRRLTAGTDLIIRLNRGEVPLPIKQGEGWAGYLHTHPADNRRLAAMRATHTAITTGASGGPISKEWAGFSKLNGYSELHLATVRKKTDTLTLLIQNGADLEVRDKMGWSPLHLACQLNEIDSMNLLLDAGAKLEARTKDKSSFTPLHIASANARPEFVSRLLDAGANIEALSADGSTPLHIAAAGGTADVVELLLDSGADPEVTNQRGQTPYELGQNNEYMQFSNALERLQGSQ